MAKSISYLKNLGKSVGYGTLEAVKSAAGPGGDSAVEYGRQIKDAMSMFGKQSSGTSMSSFIKSSPIMKELSKAKENTVKSFKTGKFFNPEAGMDSGMMDMGMEGMDLGFDESLLSDDDDTDFEVTADVGDGDDVSGGVDESTQMTVGAITAASGAQTQVTAKGLELAIGSITSFHKEFHEFSSNLIESQHEYQNKHLEHMSEVSEKISDMVKNLQFVAGVRDVKDEYSFAQSPWEKIGLSDGSFDVSEYKKVIGKRLGGDIMGGGMGGMMMQAISQDPMGFIVSQGIMAMMPKMLSGGLSKLGNTLADLPALMTMKANELKSSKNPILKFIGSTFGMSPGQTDRVDLGRYEKGPVPFDGYTKRAITDVIPNLLSKILSSVSGGEELTYDYERGRLVNKSAIAKAAQKEMTGFNTQNIVDQVGGSEEEREKLISALSSQTKSGEIYKGGKLKGLDDSLNNKFANFWQSQSLDRRRELSMGLIEDETSRQEMIKKIKKGEGESVGGIDARALGQVLADQNTGSYVLSTVNDKNLRKRDDESYEDFQKRKAMVQERQATSRQIDADFGSIESYSSQDKTSGFKQGWGNPLQDIRSMMVVLTDHLTGSSFGMMFRRRKEDSPISSIDRLARGETRKKIGDSSEDSNASKTISNESKTNAQLEIEAQLDALEGNIKSPENKNKFKEFIKNPLNYIGEKLNQTNDRILGYFFGEERVDENGKVKKGAVTSIFDKMTFKLFGDPDTKGDKGLLGKSINFFEKNFGDAKDADGKTLKKGLLTNMSGLWNREFLTPFKEGVFGSVDKDGNAKPGALKSITSNIFTPAKEWMTDLFGNAKGKGSSLLDSMKKGLGGKSDEPFGSSINRYLFGEVDDDGQPISKGLFKSENMKKLKAAGMGGLVGTVFGSPLLGTALGLFTQTKTGKDMIGSFKTYMFGKTDKEGTPISKGLINPESKKKLAGAGIGGLIGTVMGGPLFGAVTGLLGYGLTSTAGGKKLVGSVKNYLFGNKASETKEGEEGEIAKPKSMKPNTKKALAGAGIGGLIGYTMGGGIIGSGLLAGLGAMLPTVKRYLFGTTDDEGNPVPGKLSPGLKRKLAGTGIGGILGYQLGGPIFGLAGSLLGLAFGSDRAKVALFGDPDDPDKKGMFGRILSAGDSVISGVFGAIKNIFFGKDPDKTQKEMVEQSEKGDGFVQRMLDRSSKGLSSVSETTGKLVKSGSEQAGSLLAKGKDLGVSATATAKDKVEQAKSFASTTTEAVKNQTVEVAENVSKKFNSTVDSVKSLVSDKIVEPVSNISIGFPKLSSLFEKTSNIIDKYLPDISGLRSFTNDFSKMNQAGEVFMSSSLTQVEFETVPDDIASIRSILEKTYGPAVKSDRLSRIGGTVGRFFSKGGSLSKLLDFKNNPILRGLRSMSSLTGRGLKSAIGRGKDVIGSLRGSRLGNVEDSPTLKVLKAVKNTVSSGFNTVKNITQGGISLLGQMLSPLKSAPGVFWRSIKSTGVKSYELMSKGYEKTKKFAGDKFGQGLKRLFDFSKSPVLQGVRKLFDFKNSPVVNGISNLFSGKSEKDPKKGGLLSKIGGFVNPKTNPILKTLSKIPGVGLLKKTVGGAVGYGKEKLFGSKTKEKPLTRVEIVKIGKDAVPLKAIPVDIVRQTVKHIIVSEPEKRAGEGNVNTYSEQKAAREKQKQKRMKAQALKFQKQNSRNINDGDDDDDGGGLFSSLIGGGLTTAIGSGALTLGGKALSAIPGGAKLLGKAGGAASMVGKIPGLGRVGSMGKKAQVISRAANAKKAARLAKAGKNVAAAGKATKGAAAAGKAAKGGGALGKIKGFMKKVLTSRVGKKLGGDKVMKALNRILPVIGKKLGPKTLLKAVGKFAGPFGLALTTAMMARAGWKGWSRAGETLGMGEDVTPTFMEKAVSSLSWMLSDLALGLIPPSMIADIPARMMKLGQYRSPSEEQKSEQEGKLQGTDDESVVDSAAEGSVEAMGPEGDPSDPSMPTRGTSAKAKAAAAMAASQHKSKEKTVKRSQSNALISDGVLIESRKQTKLLNDIATNTSTLIDVVSQMAGITTPQNTVNSQPIRFSREFNDIAYGG